MLCTLPQFAQNSGHIEELTVAHQFWHNTTFDLTHGRPDNAFIYVHNGVFLMRFNEGGSMAAQAGELIFVPKGTAYTAVFHGETEDSLLHFQMFSRSGEPLTLYEKPRLLSSGGRFAGNIEKLEKAGDVLPKAHTVSEAFRMSTKMSRTATLHMTACFYEFLDELSLFLLRADEDYRTIEPALRQLEVAPETADDVPSLARLCHVSERTLRRLFLRYTGTNPVQYREKLLLERARLLLREDNRPIGKIAAELGFRDASYFARVFRAYKGVSPTEYRRQAGR